MTKNELLLSWLETKKTGATLREINEFLGGSHRMARDRLQVLRIRGKVSHTGGHPSFIRWHSPEHAETARNKAIEIKERMRRKALDAKRARDREKSRKARTAAWANINPVHAVISANMAPPPKTRACSSVFTWRP